MRSKVSFKLSITSGVIFFIIVIFLFYILN